MGQRSRKRGRRGKPAPPRPRSTPRGAAAAPSGRAATGLTAGVPPRAAEPTRAGAPSTATPTTATATRTTRSERRNAAVRATLTPYRHGERPWPIKVGALIALLLGGVQLVLFLAGVNLKVAGTHAAAGSTIVFAVLMLTCAIGMWQMRYWAVLGFMALLGIAVVNFSLALVRVSSVLGLAIALVGIALPGYLFFKLVRVLSRIQMPKYPGT